MMLNSASNPSQVLAIEAHLDPDSRAILIRNIDQEVELDR